MLKKVESVTTMRSGIVLTLFALVVVFQLSMIKYTLGIGGVATAVNSLMLLGLSAIALRNIAGGAFTRSVWGGYLLPGLLVFGGFLLNISLNLISNANVASYFGLLIPWAAYLSVPFFIRNINDTEAIWRFFYRFMLIVSAIGLLEYTMTFSGVLPLRIIETPLGDFATGGLSVFFMPKDGLPHYRMHGIFPEPGTNAMYLLLAIMYALIYKKYIGLIVFAVAFILSDSLGGYISLLLLALCYIFAKIRRLKWSIGVTMIPIVILATGLAINVAPHFSETYSNKGDSAGEREQNFSNVINNLPTLLLDKPLGMALAEGTLSETSDKQYLGSNFTPGTAYTIGGDFAFLGYSLAVILCLVIPLASLRKKMGDIDQQVVFPTLLALLPFVFQRSTVMDSAAFAFLFAPSIIRFLQSKREKRWTPLISENLDNTA